MIRYWIGVASLEHVLKGKDGGFAQVCHGKPGPLKTMKGDDWIIYYSPTIQFGGKAPCRSFTAIGKICAEDPYAFAMSEDFIPWRRNVNFLPSKQTPIEPLLEQLTFIKDKKKWGFPFRRGCFEITEKDFLLISRHMKVI
jgi:hypothetical protein